jgi:hypothetical protein
MRAVTKHTAMLLTLTLLSVAQVSEQFWQQQGDTWQ